LLQPEFNRYLGSSFVVWGHLGHQMQGRLKVVFITAWSGLTLQFVTPLFLHTWGNSSPLPLTPDDSVPDRSALPLESTSGLILELLGATHLTMAEPSRAT